MTEAVLALGSVVLSILGIVGLFPTYISGIAGYDFPVTALLLRARAAVIKSDGY